MMGTGVKGREQEPENALAQTVHVCGLLRFAFPSIFMMLFMGLYTIVDTIFVARFVDAYALSAINIVCPIVNVLVGLGSMLAAGGSAAVAKKMGNGEHSEARRIFTMVLLVGAAAGCCISFLGLLFLDSIIQGLGASELLFPYCKDYLSVLMIFAPANILQVLMQNFLITAGKPGMGFWLTLGAGLTNALFDFILIVPMQWGIRGAALATSLGYLVPSVAGILFFSRNRQGILYFCRPTFDYRLLGRLCFNGSSEMVSQLSAAVTTFLFNGAMMRLLGEAGVAAITIMIYSQFMLTTLYIGFSIGVAPVISYNHGSQNHSQLRRIFKICMAFILSVSFLVFVFSMAGGPAMAGVFSPKGSCIYEIARVGFMIFPFSFLFCGINIFTSALFTALSNGKISAALSFLRTFGFLVIGLLTLPIVLKEVGVWLAVPLAELLTLFLSAFFLWRYRDKYHY